MPTKSFTKGIILSKEGSERLEKIMKAKKSCEYCKDGIKVETVIVDGCYYTAIKDTKYCPFCGRKLEDV